MTRTPVETSEEIEVAASLWAVKERPLTPQDELLLSEWLSGDGRRRGAYLRAQATWSSLSRAKALGPLAEWNSPKTPVLHRLSRRNFFIAAGSVGGLAAAGIGGLFISQHYSEAATATGEIRRLPMSDGSVAAINTDSAIRIDMTDSQRNIELVRGEVWFKVAKNKQRPFIVSAGLARVQAVGTAFSVRRSHNGAEVLVTEGTVKAWLNGGDRPAQWLSAGDRTFISNLGPTDTAHTPEAIDNALAWREGHIVLTGQSLAAAAEEYNRYNRLKIVIRDPDLGQEHLLGRFSTDDPEAFSDAVAHAFGAEITRTDKAIYIDMKKK